MTTNLNALLALAEQEAAEGIDLNEVVKGGGGGRLLPVGYAFGQFVEYIELGKQPQEFGGQVKQPALEYTVGFALSGQAVDATGNVIGQYHNDDGTPYIVRPYSLALSQNEKSGTHKLFKALNWRGTAKNFAQLLGQKFLVKIVHVPKSKADPTIVSRIDLTGFLPALDPVSKQPYPIVDAADSTYRLFLWNRPTKEAWDSLYIEGQYEAKDGKPAASKNRIQETILAAVDFQGSPLQLLLGGAVQALPEVAAPAVAAVPVAAAPLAVPAVATPQPVSVPAVTPAAVPVAATPVESVPLAVPVVAAQPVVPVAVPVAAPVGVPPTAIAAVPPAAVPSNPVLPA